MTIQQGRRPHWGTSDLGEEGQWHAFKAYRASPANLLSHVDDCRGWRMADMKAKKTGVDPRLPPLPCGLPNGVGHAKVLVVLKSLTIGFISFKFDVIFYFA